MALELCPLLLATLPKGATRNMAQCAKENCMWFHQMESSSQQKMGLCSIFKIGYELSQINSKLHDLRKALKTK